MNYKGKLYGKIGDNYFDTGKTSDNYDDLLEALQSMIDSFGYYDLGLIDDEGMDAIKQAREAIRKATE